MTTFANIRRVTVVMSDAFHTIHLVEVQTRARYDTDKETFRVDKFLTEKLARSRLAELGRNADAYDFVGVLVAHFGVPHTRGRITWAEEVETSPAVEV